VFVADPPIARGSTREFDPDERAELLEDLERYVTPGRDLTLHRMEKSEQRSRAGVARA
jgi:hypothetical protein